MFCSQFDTNLAPVPWTVSFTDFCNKILMSVKFSAKIVNVLKLRITLKLHTKFEDCTAFCSNVKTEKRIFYRPWICEHRSRLDVMLHPKNAMIFVSLSLNRVMKSFTFVAKLKRLDSRENYKLLDWLDVFYIAQ